MFDAYQTIEVHRLAKPVVEILESTEIMTVTLLSTLTINMTS